MCMDFSLFSFVLFKPGTAVQVIFCSGHFPAHRQCLYLFFAACFHSLLSETTQDAFMARMTLAITCQQHNTWVFFILMCMLSHAAALCVFFCLFYINNSLPTLIFITLYFINKYWIKIILSCYACYLFKVYTQGQKEKLLIPRCYKSLRDDL